MQFLSDHNKKSYEKCSSGKKFTFSYRFSYFPGSRDSLQILRTGSRKSNEKSPDSASLVFNTKKLIRAFSQKFGIKQHTLSIGSTHTTHLSFK